MVVGKGAAKGGAKEAARPLRPENVPKLAADECCQPCEKAQTHPLCSYTLRMVTLSRMFCQLNRLAWGPLLVFMGPDLNLTTHEKGSPPQTSINLSLSLSTLCCAGTGVLLSAFSAGYLMTQITGAMIGDFWGGKHLQTVALVGAGLGTGAVALGCSTSLVGLSLIYAGMGLLCGPQHPTAAKMVADWTLPSERNWASGDSSRLHYSGTAVTAASH